MNLLLTVCIPTLNRSQRAYSLAKYLAHHVNSRWLGKVAIVVSDNHSKDSTPELFGATEIPGVQFIRRESFIDSAEEHIVRLIEESKSEFIWLLGDDDIPNLETFDLLITYLEQDVADIFVFNHSEILKDGDLLTSQMLEMNGQYIDISGRELPQIAGFISTLSMFSNVVFKRVCLSIENGKDLISRSPIYSHVAWHIMSFNDKRARVVNYQLVNHRADFKSIKTYFAARDKSKKQSHYHSWTTGLLLLINHLIENNYLTPQEVAMIYEHDFNGTRFRLLDRVIHFIFLRLQAAAADKKKRQSESHNRITESEFILFLNTLLISDARLQDQLFVLQQISDQINKSNTSWLAYYLLVRKFKKLHGAQTPWLMYASAYVAKIHGYSIYKVVVGYVAISNRENYHNHYREEVLNQIDPEERMGKVLFSKELEALITKVSERRVLDNAHYTEVTLPAAQDSSQQEDRLTAYFALTPLRWFGKSLILMRLLVMRTAYKISKFLR